MLANLLGDIINLDHVKTIEGLPSDLKTSAWRTSIRFTDGTTKIINCPMDRVERLAGAIIAAPHGYAVIEALPPDEFSPVATYIITPVIAFQREIPEGPLMPITPCGEPGDGRWAVIWPDGRCDSPYDTIHETVEAFKACFERDLELKVPA